MIGDIMLDRYVYGQASRISPEAPVPVLKIEKEGRRIGGVGTVLRNIAALNGNSTILSVIGADEPGREVIEMVGGLPNVEPYIIKEGPRITTIKTRLLAGHHQIARMDAECSYDINLLTQEHIIKIFSSDVPKCDVVILSDYGKGVVTETLVREIIAQASKHKKPVVLDSKSHILESLKDVEVFTPNLHELGELTGLKVDSREDVINRCQDLIDEYGIRNILATRGRDGMILQTNNNNTYDYDATATGVVDVTGAGDTVVAVLALGLAIGWSLPSAAKLANIAAGLVVGKIGSATITPEELGYAWAQHNASGRTTA